MKEQTIDFAKASTDIVAIAEKSFGMPANEFVQKTLGVSCERVLELVKAEREGRLMVLPCKIGDTVYQIDVSVCKWRDLDKCDVYCSGYGECWEGERIVKEVHFEPWMIDFFGKTVFLTREAAEETLKGANKCVLIL